MRTDSREHAAEQAVEGLLERSHGLGSDPTVTNYGGGKAAPRLAPLGTSCPDHFLRTKV